MRSGTAQRVRGSRHCSGQESTGDVEFAVRCAEPLPVLVQHSAWRFPGRGLPPPHGPTPLYLTHTVAAFLCATIDPLRGLLKSEAGGTDGPIATRLRRVDPEPENKHWPRSNRPSRRWSAARGSTSRLAAPPNPPQRAALGLND